MVTPGVRLIDKNEIPFLASFLAGIFIHNTFYIYIFSDQATRESRLKWIFEKNLLLQNAEKNTWVMTSGDAGKITDVKDIIATLTFLPSTERKSSVVDYIQKGLLAMPIKFGFKAFSKLLKLNKLNEDGISQIAANMPFWYLTMVGVGTEYRGKGIAQ